MESLDDVLSAPLSVSGKQTPGFVSRVLSRFVFQLILDMFCTNTTLLGFGKDKCDMMVYYFDFVLFVLNI